MPLMRHLIEDRRMSRRDIQELRQLVEQLEVTGHSSQVLRHGLPIYG